MKLALIVSATANNSYSALEFVKAAVNQHTLTAIFFYQQGVTIADHDISLPVDEINLQQQWQDLAKKYSIPLLVCSSSSLRRGIAVKQLAKYFVISSLGQLTEIMVAADRIITFK